MNPPRYLIKQILSMKEGQTGLVRHFTILEVKEYYAVVHNNKDDSLMTINLYKYKKKHDGNYY